VKLVVHGQHDVSYEGRTIDGMSKSRGQLSALSVNALISSVPCLRVV
jgi:hypothetical protein